jgi:transposase-like protein
VSTEYGSQYEAIRSVAGQIGCNPETTLRGWVRQAERDAGQRPGLRLTGVRRWAARQLQ